VWKPLQAATRLKAGLAWHDPGLIFTATIGRPLDGQLVRRFFDRALTEAQVWRRRLYALRQTMATLMLLRRESPKLVAARLGHAHETLVLRTYGHVIPGQDQEAADRLAQMLRDLHCTRSAQAAIAGLDRYAAAGSHGSPFQIRIWRSGWDSNPRYPCEYGLPCVRWRPGAGLFRPVLVIL